MKSTESLETSVYIYQSKRINIPDFSLPVFDMAVQRDTARRLEGYRNVEPRIPLWSSFVLLFWNTLFPTQC
jgi:hypothetical protein